MRFRQNTQDTSIPTIDLIPMLTVMMGVLAFFVVVSASLGSEQLVPVDLSSEQSSDTAGAAEAPKEPFIVQMDASGQPLLNSEPISRELLIARVQAYLTQNQDSTVYLVPSPALPYEQVMQFLGDMRSVGGDRVSLALPEIPPRPTIERPDRAE
jgi:biopolymer transport protein ExbD